MIAACPKCSARYRIDKANLRPEGVRLRCAKCEAVFRVRTPENQPSPSAPAAAERSVPLDTPGAGVESSPTKVSAALAGRSTETEPPPPVPDENAVRVLVADPLADEGKVTANALAEWGVHPILVHDGVEAILTIQRTLPAAVIIDAALPKMYGFQICELLKRNESLRHIHVILVGAIHDRRRYRRDPAELYGADAYLERPQLPEALWPMLRGFGLQLRGSRQETGTSAAPVSVPPPLVRKEPIAIEPAAIGPETDAPEAPRPQPRVAQPSAVSAPPEPRPAADAGQDAEIAKAERLARIVVSDIILYNQEKFDAAVQRGTTSSPPCVQ